MATEGNLEMEERGEWAAASGGLDLAKAETPRFSGRALVALLEHPEYCAENTGSYQVVSELASQFDFTDVDGRRAPSIRSLQYLVPNFLLTDAKIADMPAWQRGFATKFRDEWTPDYLLPWSVFSGGRRRSRRHDLCLRFAPSLGGPRRAFPSCGSRRLACAGLIEAVRDLFDARGVASAEHSGLPRR